MIAASTIRGAKMTVSWRLDRYMKLTRRIRTICRFPPARQRIHLWRQGECSARTEGSRRGLLPAAA
jgi:hypothetical protein